MKTMIFKKTDKIKKGIGNFKLSNDTNKNKNFRETIPLKEMLQRCNREKLLYIISTESLETKPYRNPVWYLIASNTTFLVTCTDF
jgi:hypothetical protein